MGRPDGFNVETSQLDLVTCFYGPQVALYPVFFQLVLYQSQSKLGPVDWKLDLFEQVRNGAYVVLMPMGYYHTHDLFPVFHHIAEIRYYDIYSVHLVFRKA